MKYLNLNNQWLLYEDIPAQILLITEGPIRMCLFFAQLVQKSMHNFAQICVHMYLEDAEPFKELV